MIQHKCEDPECIYLGQPTAQSCKCHRTSDQMMAARIEALENVLREILDWDELPLRIQWIARNVLAPACLAEAERRQEQDK